jgi:TrmH family RNA methyltransferase
VIQASAGTIASVKLFQLSWQELVKTAHEKNLSLCALVVSGGKPPSAINFSNSLLVIGNEAHGLSASMQHDCDQLMTIPMPGGTESLNAAVAGSIVLYLAYQQKGC